MPTGSQPVSASRHGRARPASARPLIGRTTRNTEIPNTQIAIEKNIGASPRPYTPAGLSTCMVTSAGEDSTWTALSCWS